MNSSDSPILSRRTFVQAASVGAAATALNPAQSASVLATRARQPSSSNLPEISHRQVKANGIQMHIAEAGKGFPVICLHGFSELWHSWRFQLPAIAAAGFHAIAPDQRGYGGTDAPKDIESYSMRHLTADIVGLIEALGAKQAVLVANNWGSGVAWACAQLYPERVAAMFHLNIPHCKARRRTADPVHREVR